MLICFDWRFPETSRALALLGADVIAHPSNLVFPNAQKAMLTRSLENRVYTVTANRTGTERRPGGTVPFTGRSQIVGAQRRAGRARGPRGGDGHGRGLRSRAGARQVAHRASRTSSTTAAPSSTGRWSRNAAGADAPGLPERTLDEPDRPRHA